MALRASNPASPLSLLRQERQSVWLDYMHRRMLKDGELKAMIEARGMRGATSNPTIFEQAIGQSDTYDEAIQQLAAKGKGTIAIYETLAIEDIQGACDLFRPIYEMSQGNDGFVSMEVSPRLAADTSGTIAEAKRLWQAIARPNAMIKIHITLLFAVGMYEQVIEAYLKALEQRVAAGKPIDTIRSVASFFVSRVDTETDKRLEALKRPAETAPLMGKAAIANAKLAYEAFTKRFEADRFRKLMAKGGAVQRPLWASTGTKNKAYSDTMYVDQLIGPDTVNTMPPATLEAFADHGTVTRTIDKHLPEAKQQLAALEALGVKLKDVTDFLVADGVKKFAESFTQLLAAVDAKRAKLAGVS